MLEKFGLVPTKAQSVVVGNRFGRLSVVAIGQKPGTYRYKAVCVCDCGSEPKSIRMDSLKSGAITSCGCFQREVATTHGMTNSGHRHRWSAMMDRCYNENVQSYPNYGGRGIKVCERWHDISNFVADIADGHFEGAEIDRINNDGDYEPGNVRWATRSQNMDNRRNSQILEFQGRSQSIIRWAEELGLSAPLIYNRIEAGWSAEDALTAPPMDAATRMAKAREARWGGHQKKQPKTARRLHYVEIDGEQITLAEAAKRYGIPAKLLAKRIFERGWSIDRALTKPTRSP